jgi:hypothetical protein
MNVLTTLRIRALPQELQNFIRLLIPVPSAAVPIILPRLKNFYIDTNSQVYYSTTTLARQLVLTLTSRNTVPTEVLEEYLVDDESNCATYYDRTAGGWRPMELKKSLKLHLLQITNFDCSESDRVRLAGVADRFSIVWDNMDFEAPAPSQTWDSHLLDGWMKEEEESDDVQMDSSDWESDPCQTGISSASSASSGERPLTTGRGEYTEF